MTKLGDAVQPSAMISDKMSADGNDQQRLEMIGNDWKRLE
jgi:hypothetical protein